MNVIIEISYDGLEYFGWQIQPNKKTVQGEIIKALLSIFKQDIKVIASGRTDTGVSAIKQVANFVVDTFVPAEKIKHLLNDVLPLNIRILKSYETNCAFNARLYAKRKTYGYNFYFGDEENAYYNKFAIYFKKELNIKKMEEACEYLIGTHDFSSFCAAKTSITNKTRTIYSAKILKYENYFQFEITGNGFLYNMIRILMGTLLLVGYEKMSLLEFKNVIESKNRKQAGKTVSPYGLVLKNVEY